MKTQPELYLPIPLASNVWAIISSPFKQQPPVTVICPTKPTMSIHISPPIHVLRVEPACSTTSQHFHLPPKYEDTHVTMNLSIYNANLTSSTSHPPYSGSLIYQPIYQPSGIIPTVIRPQESHGLCVIPQPA